MHEVGLMESALQAALDCAARRGAGRIHRMTLRVGSLSGVVPEALAFAFAAVTAGTAAEGARLEIEEVQVVCRCPDCGREFAPPDVVFECPGCGRLSGDVRQGRELELASLEVS